MIFIIVAGALGVLTVLAVAFIVIPAIKRAEEFTPEEAEIVALFGQMRAEDTGGLLALPRYDTTVAIAAVDRQAAVRTLTVHHEPTQTSPAGDVLRQDSPAEDSPAAAAPPTVAAGPPEPGAASLEPGPESEAESPAAPVPVPATTPPVEPDGCEWQHDTAWFRLDAILADADARAEVT